MKKSTICFLVILLLAGSATLRANGKEMNLRLDTSVEEWSLDRAAGGETTLMEMTNRIGFSCQLSDAIRCQLISGWVKASRSDSSPTDPDAEIDIQGLLDTRARFSYLVGDNWLFRLGINGPTGLSEYKTEELPLVEALSSRILAMRAFQLGQGADLDAGFSYAYQKKTMAFGLGGGYVYKGEYSTVEGGADYKAGNQILLAGGFDVKYPAWLWRNNGRVVFSGVDQFNDKDQYRLGTRFEVQTKLLHRRPNTSFWGALAFITFGKSEISGSDALTVDNKSRHGNEFYFDLGANHRITRKIDLFVLTSSRIFSGNDYNQSKGSRHDFSGGCKIRFNPRVGLEAEGRYGTGTLDQEFPELGNAVKSSLSGFRIRTTLTLRL